MPNEISNTTGRVSSPIAQPSRKRSEEKLAAASTSSTSSSSDRVELSDLTQRVHAESGFDQTKVDTIRKAIIEGAYPLDPKRMAESFAALEKMLGNSSR